MDQFPFKRQMTISRSILAGSNPASPKKSERRSKKSKSATPSLIILNANELEDLHSKILRIQKYFEQLRSEIVTSAAILTKEISNYSKLALNTLIEYEFEMLNLQHSAKRGKSINNDKMLKILRFFIPKEAEKISVDHVVKEVKKLYDFRVDDIEKPKVTHATHELICVKDYISGMISIDLNTFQVSKVRFAPKVFPYCSIVPITNKKFFVNGGYTGSASVTDTFVVDFASRSYEKFNSSIRRDSAGVVVKENKVFVFGGIEKREASLDYCEYFDLGTYNWTQISPLPYLSHANTATLVENRIFLLGFQSDHLLEFNEKHEEFRQIIEVPANCMKFIFENWIITPEEILEFDISQLKWQRYRFPSKLEFGWLFNFSCTRAEGFIYFIDDVNGLLRFDIEQKKIDKIV